MDCSLSTLLRGCLKERIARPPRRVALLIEGFPRPQHPIVEFAKLLYLLRVHGAKATFVVDWQDIRERGLSSRVAEMMKLLRHNEHEVAIKFKTDLCSAPHLRQHAAEALHFLQRVYGITVVSAKVGCRWSSAAEALGSLGVTVVDGVGVQRVVRDTEYVLYDLQLALRACGGKECVCVSALCQGVTL